jgi:hypothetical protein
VPRAAICCACSTNTAVDQEKREAGFGLGRSGSASPLRHAWLSLQRRQIRSPAQALSNAVRQRRHKRVRWGGLSGSWAELSTIVKKWVRSDHFLTAICRLSGPDERSGAANSTPAASALGIVLSIPLLLEGASGKKKSCTIVS